MTDKQRSQVFCDFCSLMGEAADSKCPNQYDSFIVLKNIEELSQRMMKTIKEKKLLKK